MKSNDLLIACYFERDGNQWLGFCLDYSLVTQAGSLADAEEKLLAQVSEYIYDATVGQDRQHAGYLLRRRAPLSYWVKFYWTLFRQHQRHAAQANKRQKAERAPMPLVPASCVA